MAMNQVRSGLRVPSKMVPAVSDVRAWQLRQRSSWSDIVHGSPLTAQCGQMNPDGQRRRRMYSRHAASSRNHWSISWNVRG
jgi:hypothetical protein